MIVIDTNNIVLGSGPLIERVNAQGEENLIKVCRTEETDRDFFYIGTDDRDQYTILEDLTVLDSTKNWKYVNGVLEEFTIPTTKTW